MRSTIQMFQLPVVIALSIAAARMYRTLTDFVSGVTHRYDIKSSYPSPISYSSITICRRLYGGLGSDKSNSKGSGSHVNQNPLDPIEVAVDMSYEQHQMSRMGHHDPCTSPELASEEQKCEKPHTYELRQTFEEAV